MHSIADAVAALREHFGFDDFREGQREVIAAILEGKDAVVVMPTGSGKSLCYQLPALMLNGATHRRLSADCPDEGPSGRTACPATSGDVHK